jgi:Fic family protein
MTLTTTNETPKSAAVLSQNVESEYLRTHPWLTFEVDLRRVSFELWMKLGAIESKVDHVTNVMVPPAAATELLGVYLAKGVHATTAIEGNSLTEEQVLNRIQKKSPLPQSLEYQGVEIDNFLAACNDLANKMIEKHNDCDLDVTGVCKFNEMVLAGLPLEDHVVPGHIRSTSVVVSDYRGPRYSECEYLLARMCEWINGIHSENHEVGFAVIKAVMAHLYIAWIHPFGDGNGRTARLVEVQVLLGAGVPMVAAHLLSNHYNKTRSEYYRQLSRASKSGGDVIPFLEYAIQGLLDGLIEQIKCIRKYQRDVAWKDYVYDRFREKHSMVAQRRRALALELGRKSGARIREISGLTPELAKLYATKTERTVLRDVVALRDMKLVVVRGTAVKANRKVLKAFKPRCRGKDADAAQDDSE